MEAVIQAVKDGTGVNRATDIHGVPKMTSKDRVSGRVAHGSNLGPKPLLIRRKLSYQNIYWRHLRLDMGRHASK